MYSIHAFLGYDFLHVNSLTIIDSIVTQ